MSSVKIRSKMMKIQPVSCALGVLLAHLMISCVQSTPPTDLGVEPPRADLGGQGSDVMPADLDMQAVRADQEVMSHDQEVSPLDMEMVPSDMEVVEPDIDVVEPDMELVEPDMELVEPDMELVEPDMELIELDMEMIEPDMEVIEPDMEMIEPDMEIIEPDMEMIEPDMALPQPVCGDGVVEGLEVCDNGANNSHTLPNACRLDCHPDHRDALVPFLQDSYIVQGVASSCESLDTSECEEERLYLSLYFKDADGNDAAVAGYEDQRSLIVELNPRGERPFSITRCWELNGDTDRSHVGGLAYAAPRDGAQYIYVSGASKIERYTLPSLEVTPELDPDSLAYGSREACGLLGDASNQVWSVPASSYISHVLLFDVDHLLVGRFCSDSDCDSRAYAYPLNMDDGSISVNGPHEELVTRIKAQGVEVDGGELYVSVSYGDNDSYIYQDSLADALCTAPGNCASASVRQLRRLTVKGGVAGGEDLARVGAHLWSASESGSRHFQNRPIFRFPWSSYFPYIYDVSIGPALHAPATSPQDAINSRHAKNVTHLFSNLYNDWWDRDTQIRVLDANGDGREDVLLGPDQSSGCWYLLEGAESPTGATLIDRGCVVRAYEGWWNNQDRVRVMDVNGDDRDDVVIGPYSQNGCWYVLQGAQTGGQADLIDRGCVVNYKDNWHDSPERIRPLDINGDGADDILIGPSSNGNWYLLEGRMGAIADFESGRTLELISPSYGGWWDNPDRVRVIDANGDGRDDILIGPYSENGCWYLLQGRAAPTVDLVDRGCVVMGYAGWYDNTERIRIADFTGDEREDVLIGPHRDTGRWYLIRGSGGATASLSDSGRVHSNYAGWADNPRRVRIAPARGSTPAGILIGPKRDLGEWQLLQGHSGGLYDLQWSVNTKEEWGEEDGDRKPERTRIMDVNGDLLNDVLIGPSSSGNWYLIEGR